MAFLARFPRGLLVWRNCNHHLFPAPAESKKAIAFPLRLRTSFLTFTNPSPCPSLLRHHHHRLLSTSNSAASADDPNSNNPSPSLLRVVRDAIKQISVSLYHRLLSTSGAGADYPNSTSNHPSPSLLREVREAIKQLSASLDNCDPTSSTFPSPPPFNSEEAEQNSLQSESANLDNKLEQLKLSAVSLRHRQAIDHRRIWEMDDSRVALCLAFEKNLHRFLRGLEEQALRLTIELPQTNQKLRNEFDSFITRFTRLKETMVVVVQLSETLTNSRLASLQEIINDLSEIRKDMQQEVFDEFNEGLMKGKEMEEKELELMVEKTNEQLVFLEERFQILLELRSEIPIATGSDNSVRHANS